MNDQNSTSVNRVFLIGRIEKLPRQHNNAHGCNHLRFSLITEEMIYSDRRQPEHVELHHLVIDSDHTDIRGLQLYKGDQLYIMGKTQIRTWNDTENIKRYKTEIHVSQLKIL